MKRILAVVLALAACEAESRATPQALHAPARPTAAPVALPAAAPVVHWPADRDSNQLAALSAAELRHLPPCQSAPTVTADSIGPLAPGRTAAEVLVRCPGSRLLWDWGDEGTPEPAMLVRLGGGVVDVVFEDTLAESRSYRLLTTDSVFRTAEGIGPGSHFGELLRAYGPPDTLADAECVLFAAYTRMPGLTWRLHLGNNVDCQEVARIADTRDAGRVPRSALIEGVLLGRAADPETP